MKDIKGYEGQYAITEDGQVWSYKSGKFLSFVKDKDGYYKVWLYDGNGQKRDYRVHRLVAEAYLPNPNEWPSINHKDECRTNNSVDNLEWCSVEYNDNYGARNYHISVSKGYVVGQYDMSGNLVATYHSMMEAERQTGIRNSNISQCTRGLRHTAGGYIWRLV